MIYSELIFLYGVRQGQDFLPPHIDKLAILASLIEKNCPFPIELSWYHGQKSNVYICQWSLHILGSLLFYNQANTALS